MFDELDQDELALLRAAVIKVSQFMDGFAAELWGVTPAAARKRLSRLEERKLLKARNVLASKPPSITKPICSWNPGEPSPHCGEASYEARSRWKEIPVEVCRVYTATDLGRALFGRAPVKPPRDVQTAHDLGLTATYLFFRKTRPRLTERCWLNESEYAHHRGRGVKVEDAMLAHRDRVLLLVDFAGAYRPDRIEALIKHADQYNVPIAIF